MGNSEIELIDPKRLKEHPFSTNIYGRDNQEDITISIKEHGILMPLVIQGDVVISGHRRLRAALDIGIEAVPCIRQQYASLMQEQEAILEHNRYRLKNGLQLYREGMALKEIERLKARQRQIRGGRRKVRQDLGQSREERKTRYRIAKSIGLGSGEQWRKLDYIAQNNPELLEQIGSPGLTVNKAYGIAKQLERRKNLLENIPAGEVNGSVVMRYGSFEKLSSEIPDNSVELILTNPAFTTACIDKWEGLSSVASRVLVDGGFLISYISKLFFLENASAMTKHLNYFWMIAFTLPSSRRRLGQPHNVFTYWIPILIFSKGEPRTKAFKGWQDFLLDKSPQRFNRWSCIPSARYLVSIFSSPGATVLDPFAHTGEFLIAALLEGRHAYGYESNPDHYNIAMQRLFKEGSMSKLICPRQNCSGRLFKDDDEIYCIQCGYRVGERSYRH